MTTTINHLVWPQLQSQLRVPPPQRAHPLVPRKCHTAQQPHAALELIVFLAPAGQLPIGSSAPSTGDAPASAAMPHHIIVHRHTAALVCSFLTALLFLSAIADLVVQVAPSGMPSAMRQQLCPHSIFHRLVTPASHAQDNHTRPTEQMHHHAECSSTAHRLPYCSPTRTRSLRPAAPRSRHHSRHQRPYPLRRHRHHSSHLLKAPPVNIA